MSRMADSKEMEGVPPADRRPPLASYRANLRIRARRQFLMVRQDGTLRWLAMLASNRWVSLGSVAVIAITDLTIPWHEFGFVPRALADEPCHLVTTLVVLGAMTRLRGSPPSPLFGWVMLSSSVLIDLDHLPLEFGSSILTAGTPRPYTHAFWVVAVLAAAAVVARYWRRHANTPASEAAMRALAGAAWGVSAHFLRDIATAPMSFWWPASSVAVQVPYGWYMGALAVIIAVPPMRQRRHDVQNEPSDLAASLVGEMPDLDRPQMSS